MVKVTEAHLRGLFKELGIHPDKDLEKEIRKENFPVVQGYLVLMADTLRRSRTISPEQADSVIERSGLSEKEIEALIKDIPLRLRRR